MTDLEARFVKKGDRVRRDGSMAVGTVFWVDPQRPAFTVDYNGRLVQVFGRRTKRWTLVG